MATPNGKRGLTLLEIQVYLCIYGSIFLICGVVFASTYAKAKKNAHRATCASNIHRLGLSLYQYITDNDDALPSADAWKNRSFTTEKLDGCPNAISTTQDTIKGVKGYSYNEAFTTTVKNHRVGVSYDAIKIPMLTVAVCEESVQHPTTDGPNPFHNSGGEPPSGEEKGWLRHFDGGNYLFADGHVKWHQPDGIGYTTTEMTRGNSAPTFALRPIKKR